MMFQPACYRLIRGHFFPVYLQVFSGDFVRDDAQKQVLEAIKLL